MGPGMLVAVCKKYLGNFRQIIANHIALFGQIAYIDPGNVRTPSPIILISLIIKISYLVRHGYRRRSAISVQAIVDHGFRYDGVKRILELIPYCNNIGHFNWIATTAFNMKPIERASVAIAKY